MGEGLLLLTTPRYQPFPLGALAAFIGTEFDIIRSVSVDDVTVSGDARRIDRGAVYRERAASELPLGRGVDFDRDELLSVGALDALPSRIDLAWMETPLGVALVRGPLASCALVPSDVSYAELPLALVRKLRWGAELSRVAVPVLDRPPQTARGEDAPLLLGVRTSDGRLGKCAVWRDDAGALFLRYTVFDAAVPALDITRRLAVLRRERVGGSPDGGSGILTEYQRVVRVTLDAVARQFEPDRVLWRLERAGPTLSGTGVARLDGGRRIAFDARGPRLELTTELGVDLDVEVYALAIDRNDAYLSATTVVRVTGTEAAFDLPSIAPYVEPSASGIPALVPAFLDVPPVVAAAIEGAAAPLGIAGAARVSLPAVPTPVWRSVGVASLPDLEDPVDLVSATPSRSIEALLVRTRA